MQRWAQHLIARRRLRDPRYHFLFGREPTDEAVALDCETTGLDPRTDTIVSIAAIPIRGSTIHASERLEVLVRADTPAAAAEGDLAVPVHRVRPVDRAGGVPIGEALDTLLHLIGPRPIVGYYIEFDLAMINKYLVPWLGIRLPNRAIEVSRLYYDRYSRHQPHHYIDLSFDTMVSVLDVPTREHHDAFNDALLAAMMYLKLTQSG